MNVCRPMYACIYECANECLLMCICVLLHVCMRACLHAHVIMLTCLYISFSLEFRPWPSDKWLPVSKVLIFFRMECFKLSVFPLLFHILPMASFHQPL